MFVRHLNSFTFNQLVMNLGLSYFSLSLQRENGNMEMIESSIKKKCKDQLVSMFLVMWGEYILETICVNNPDLGTSQRPDSLIIPFRYIRSTSRPYHGIC